MFDLDEQTWKVRFKKTDKSLIRLKSKHFKEPEFHVSGSDPYVLKRNPSFKVCSRKLIKTKNPIHKLNEEEQIKGTINDKILNQIVLKD